jgi:pimeloyl-ACP methyl ester carboxylesterase
MLAALRHQELISGLAVVDMAPRGYPPSTSDELICAMRDLNLGNIHSRAQAEEALLRAVPQAALRQLALQNLRLEGQSYRWEPNIDLLAASMETIRAWPQTSARYLGPTLWLRGANSAYTDDSDIESMRRHFPNVLAVVIPHAGHQLHVDQPQMTVAALNGFAAQLET